MIGRAHATVRAWFNAYLESDVNAALRPLCIAKPQLHSVLGTLVEAMFVEAMFVEAMRADRVDLAELLRRVELRTFAPVALQGDAQVVATRWHATVIARRQADDGLANQPIATPPAAATPLSIEGSTWFRLADGLIAEAWHHWDCEPLLAWLGIALGKPPR